MSVTDGVVFLVALQRLVQLGGVHFKDEPVTKPHQTQPQFQTEDQQQAAPDWHPLKPAE